MKGALNRGFHFHFVMPGVLIHELSADPQQSYVQWASAFLQRPGYKPDWRPWRYAGSGDPDYAVADIRARLPPSRRWRSMKCGKLPREQLRWGASQIKIMASGGAGSPSDPIWMMQYTEAEISAAVEEAAARWRKYVMAHVYLPDAIGTVRKARRAFNGAL